MPLVSVSIHFNENRIVYYIGLQGRIQYLVAFIVDQTLVVNYSCLYAHALVPILRILHRYIFAISISRMKGKANNAK